MVGLLIRIAMAVVVCVIFQSLLVNGKAWCVWLDYCLFVSDYMLKNSARIGNVCFACDYT